LKEYGAGRVPTAEGDEAAAHAEAHEGRK